MPISPKVTGIFNIPNLYLSNLKILYYYTILYTYRYLYIGIYIPISVSVSRFTFHKNLYIFPIIMKISETKRK